MVEHQDRLTRVGFRSLDTLLNRTQDRAIEVVHQAENRTKDPEDLLADLRVMVYAFCARLYGQRLAKCQTEALVREVAGKEAKGDKMEDKRGDGDATG